MDVGITISIQIFKMFLLMSVGYYIYHKKWIDDVGSQQISNILLRICAPAITIASLNIPFSMETLKGMGLTFFLSAVAISIGLIIAKLIYKDKNKIEQFSVAFSNSGFIGIPLVQSLLGLSFIMCISTFNVVFNLFAWTFGVYLVSGRKDLITPKLIFTSPAVIGLALGLLLFFSPVKLPDVVSDPLLMIAGLNSPLAMLVLGTYIAKSNIVEVFKNKQGYIVSFLRLIVVPIITILLFKLVPNQYLEIKQVVLIAASTPVAIMVAMLAQQYGGDFEQGARVVSLSTLLCLVSVPLMLILAQLIW